jgi:hypothetical protein
LKAIINRLIENKITKITNKTAFYIRAENLTFNALHSAEKGVSDAKYCGEDIIVSLTTYGRRLYDAYLPVESIMQQTVKPNKIVLWLGNELKNTELPITLKNQQKRGLEINYCEDIGSYTKLIPSLKAFPSSAIITIDDDNIYSFDIVENLLNAYKNNPKLIHSLRVHRMKLKSGKRLEKYEKWIQDYEKCDISPLNFPTGVGGVLYPPNCFNNEVFNKEVFLDICRHADDVWFKAMALLNNFMSVKIPTHNKNGKDYLSNRNVQDTALAFVNIRKKMNDVQIRAVFDKYNLYDKFK